jgi:transcriptional regulator with GAF, ATPase, and Fis domain
VPDNLSSVELAEVFGDIARSLLAANDVQTTLDAIVLLAVDTIDGCEHAAISLVEKRIVTTPAATGDIPRRVDEIQYETGEGPCLDAIRDHEVFRTSCLSKETRWPNFATRATEEMGIVSMLSIRLFVEGDTMGALNMYSTIETAFDDNAIAVGSVFAAHAAVALSAARQEAGLKEALVNRDIIGQAKGILMARGGITAEQAFAELSTASQHLNRKIRDLAQDVATTGELPAGSDHPHD